MRILVTGGAGFIGFAVIRHLLDQTRDEVLNVDKLAYASNFEAAELEHARYGFERADICDTAGVRQLFRQFRPQAVVHLAAESHVDRSIDGPGDFLQTNVLGTVSLLEAAVEYWQTLGPGERSGFRFHHVSTDEVYGDLPPDAAPATEQSPYRPSSPYSASKAAADHCVHAWHRTYGLPVLISNSSNNFGPRQFPEKLIPLIVLNAVAGRPLPVYGDGLHTRDWLFVEDHVRGLHKVLTRGRVGETYNIGGADERRNVDVVRLICDILEDEAVQKPSGVRKFEELIAFVPDRPGHDRRYALDSSKAAAEIGWAARERFEAALRSTVRWYLDNPDWCAAICEDHYDGGRLGLATQRRFGAGAA